MQAVYNAGSRELQDRFDTRSHEYRLVQRPRFVPKSECETPVPAWKRSDWAHDALPAADPANDPSREVIPR